MDDLKPCPFCGYPAVFEPFKERKGYAATVRCCNCPAEITTITLDTEEEAEMEAIEAWNRRVDEVAPTADVVERKKGKWEYVDDVDYRCSVCHKYAYGCLGEVLSGQYKYCPYCGCAMEGAKEQ